MSRNTRITELVLVAALLFNGLSFPVYADQSVPGEEVLLEDRTVEGFQENTMEITEENEEETEKATEEVAETLNETTEEPEDESLTLLLEYVGETVMPYVVENSVTDGSQRFTLEQVGLEKDGNTITIRSGADLVKLSHVTPEEYSTLTLRFTNTQSEFDTTIKQTIVIDNTTYEWDFAGLDSFQGTISVTNGTEDYPIKLVRPLFNELSDGATIDTDTDTGLLLMFAAKTDDGKENAIPSALLADTVTHTDNSTEKQWKIRVTASDQSGIMPPLIGTMAEDAQVCLSVGTNSGSYKVTQVKGNANAGLLCARMNAGASLTLTGLTTGSEGMPAVTTENGDAGSLVGTMASGTVLALGNNVSSITLPNVTASSGNAGGLVGSATNATFPQISLTGSSSNTKIEGENAGGVIGSYIFSDDKDDVTVSISNIIVSGSNAGGMFGSLQNTGTGTFTFDTSATVNVSLRGLNSQSNTGGLIGSYSVNSLNAALLLKQVSVTSLQDGTANSYGGLIGWVSGDSAAYIEVILGSTVTVKGIANNYGGLIGSLSDGGHMLKVENATINKNTNDTVKGNNIAGGVVGLFESGVLWISGAVNTFTPECGKKYFQGNYVGQRGNTLVFTTYKPKGGWQFNAGRCNDIGNWGQVLQVYGDSGLEGLLNVNTDNHTVTVTGTGTDVSDKLSFAQAALRFQLDSKGALVIDNDFYLNDVILSLTGTIDLNGTGLTGFQRDDSKAEEASVTLNCSDAEIIFPGITIYGGAENNDNVSHTRQGLFSKTSSLEVNNAEGSHLVLNGSIAVNTFNRYVYLGALVAESRGNVTATNVISKTDLTITGTSSSEERISGLVAHQNGGQVTFDSCEWDSDIECNGSNPCYLGGFLARAEQGNTVTINNCTIKGSIAKTSSGECYVGGLIASLRDHQNGSWHNILDINGLTADGVTITVISDSKTGGILGWEWMTETTDIQGVTIQNCILNGGTAHFGGLVYKGSGYWKVYDSGIEFKSENIFIGGSGSSEPSGLLLASGCKLDDHNNALYLEIQNGAYTIDDNSVTLDIGESTTFDEIVGVTESTDGNGIVSIGTDIDIAKPTKTDCDYVNQLNEDYQNPNTRYYYNLNVFGAGNNAPSGDIDSSGKMVLYSAYTHCYSGLKKYFYSSPGKITGSPLNLTGYSYYPAEQYKNIESADITFDYEDLFSNSRSSSDSTRQNYGMHTGLFTDVVIPENSTNGQTLSVQSLTLSGTVGGMGNTYGAIIRGNAQGGNTNAKLILDISGVNLNNVSIYPVLTDTDTVAPLLINSMGSYTTLNMSGVVTNGYPNTSGYAASSLIGNVGSQTASHIQLTFSDMVLCDNSNLEQNVSLFSRAWFLESFQYSSDSSGVYNFTNTLDKRYTLGQELSNTDRAEGEEGPSGRNNGEQYCFFDDTKKVCEVVGNEGAVPETFFNDYLRYVHKVENAPFHELDINLSRSDLTEGCGTYNDPYIIRTAKQLQELALALYSVVDGMQIQVDTNVLNGSELNAFNNCHVLGAENEHKTYTCAASGWFDDTTDITENVQLYLRNAYYKISDDIDAIELKGEWTGLGADADSAFCGVIDGNNQTIIITPSGNPSQFGGLIKFSMGSVVKDLTVTYTDAPAINCQGIPTNTSDASFFGGVVGWCLGGDTILNNVSVTGLSTPSVTGTNPHLAAVGGYVGMVGGAMIGSNLNYGGGVVFRGNVGGGLSSGNALADSKYFYVNPYVGRVLDGYVLSETQTLNNTDKNYQIPCISDSIYLTRDESNNVLVSDSEGLWLLSAIVNSGAGAMGNSNAYTTGKARTGLYGDEVDENQQNDEGYIGGKANTGKTKSYLSSYTSDNFDDDNICGNAVSIVLNADCNMTDYGNGFRGIGGSYGNIDSDDRLLKVTSISSPEDRTVTITLAQDRKEYTDEYQNWTTLGTGLFPVLNPDTTFAAKRLTLAGKTGITYYENLADTVNPIPNNGKLMDVKQNTLTNGYRLGCSGAGLLAGTMKKGIGTNSTMTLEYITVTGSVTGSATFAGGLIGLACINNASKNNYINNIFVSNCNYKNPTIKGYACVGGFFGYAYANEISITATSDYPMADITVQSSEASINQAKTGIGALIGRCGVTTLTIEGNEDEPMMFSGKHIITNCNNTSADDMYGTGGLVGLLGIRDKGSITIKNINIQGSVAISNNRNNNSCGILAGFLARYHRDTSFNNDGFDWTNGGNIQATISNINIAQSGGASVIVKNTKQGGALFGVMLISNATLDNISIGSDNAAVTIASENKASNASLSGLIGTVASANVTVTNATLTKINVWGQHSDSSRGSALLLGYADNNAVFNIRNAKLKNCNVAVNNANANAGIIYAEFKGATVNGYNILMDGCTVGLSLGDNNQLADFNANTSVPAKIGLKKGNTYTPYSEIQDTDIKYYTSASNVAVFGGKTNSKDVKLVGVSVQNCNTPMKDIGSNLGSGSYIIRADYQGTSMGEDYNTDSADSPYVTVNPVSPLELPDKTITGDGAVFETASTPLVGKILEEDEYYNILENSQIYLKGKIEDTTVSLSNFKNTDLNTFEATALKPDDFPVIVLQTNSSDEANRCLHSIISALTNWELCTDSNGTVTSGTKGFQSLTATSYRWNGSAFAEQQDNQSLYVEDGRFYLKPGGYDNKLQQFTLVDVAYQDPSGPDSSVYHLYIPVVVKKMFEYKFWASAKIGTTYSIDPYESLSQPVIASHGETVTAVLNYEYQWSEDEWADAMENGQNLLWNFDLGVEFDPYALPAGTRLTLIDRNNQDQVYYASAGSAVKTISFKEFKNGKVAWDADRYLCDDLKLTATQSGTGKFYRIGKTKTNDATLRDVDGNYYRTATQEDEVSSRYDLTINGLEASGKVTAQFYLSLYTSADTSGIVNSNIQCPDNLSGNLPTRRLPAYSEERPYAKRGSENKIVLGDFFTQTQSVTTTRGEEKMTETNAEIPLELTTQISFNTAIANAETLYREYAAGQRLYQKFELKLKKYPGSIQTDLVRGTQIEVQCYLGDEAIGDPVNEVLPGAVSSYPLELCWTDGELGIPAEEVRNGMVLKAKVRLTYLPAARIEQFPVRSNETSNDGIAVAASSSLAYSLDFLRSNSNHGIDIEAKCGDMIPHFYREDTGAASLYYVAYENQNGSPAESISELGINGRDGSSFTIHSAALYNVSEVRGAEAADTLKVTISLLEKQDGSTYDNLNYKAVNGSLSNYLSSLQVNAHFKKGGAIQAFGDPQDALTAADNTLYFDLRGYDPDVQIQIPITLTVLTGEGFAGTYANYRIRVSAQLMDGENQITNSAASDYIVYTNAKICQTFIDINS